VTRQASDKEALGAGDGLSKARRDSPHPPIAHDSRGGTTASQPSAGLALPDGRACAHAGYQYDRASVGLDETRHVLKVLQHMCLEGGATHMS